MSRGRSDKMMKEADQPVVKFKERMNGGECLSGVRDLEQQRYTLTGGPGTAYMLRPG